MERKDDWSLCRYDFMWDASAYDYEYCKACEIAEYLHNKHYSCEKGPIGKLVLECEDEILNATEALLDGKKWTYEQINCLIQTISLVIICFLLLAVVSIGYCYYYIGDWIKKEDVV